LGARNKWILHEHVYINQPLGEVLIFDRHMPEEITILIQERILARASLLGPQLPADVEDQKVRCGELSIDFGENGAGALSHY